MATRIYLPSSGSAAVTPATWNFPTQAGTTYTYAGVTTKIGSASASRAGATGTVSPTHRGLVRYVYGPIAAQTISGTVKGQLRCYEQNTGANATLGVAIKIITPAGADRAVLLAYTASDDNASAPPEMATTLTNRPIQNAAEATSLTLTSQAATAGDYLVVEFGWRSATTSSRTIYLNVGDVAGSDLPEDSSTTTASNPWIEFSHTFASPQALTLPTLAAASQVYATALVEAEPDQQVVYPIAPDIAQGSWTVSTGSDFYAVLDDGATANDADYITSSAAPSADTATLTLDVMQRPKAGAVVITVRCAKV